jgi:hypothetical protein
MAALLAVNGHNALAPSFFAAACTRCSCLQPLTRIFLWPASVFAAAAAPRASLEQALLPQRGVGQLRRVGEGTGLLQSRSGPRRALRSGARRDRRRRCWRRRWRAQLRERRSKPQRPGCLPLWGPMWAPLKSSCPRRPPCNTPAPPPPSRAVRQLAASAAATPSRRHRCLLFVPSLSPSPGTDEPRAHLPDHPPTQMRSSARGLLRLLIGKSPSPAAAAMQQQISTSAVAGGWADGAGVAGPPPWTARGGCRVTRPQLARTGAEPRRGSTRASRTARTAR